MNICYVANSRFPSERAHMIQIVYMCNAFAGLGHTVTLLVTDRKTDITDSPEEYFGVALNFSIVRIPVPDIAGISPWIPELFRPYVFLIQRFFFAIRSGWYIQKNKITHVYGRDEGILLLLSKIFGISVIWESHEAKFSFISRKLFEVATLVVVISEGIQDFYYSKGVRKEKMIVAHDAVDERFFDPPPSQSEARLLLGIDTRKAVVLYIGGLDKWKGVDTLFACVQPHDLFSVYVIGGKEGEIQEYREKYPFVNFLGSRPYKELPVYQQAGDVLVVPNTGKNKLSAEYTSPLKLFAYMTSRRPIVASHIPSLSNILNDEMCYFFEADNEESLRSAINECLQNPGVSREKAERAFKESLNYTWSNRASAIMKEISERNHSA